MIMMILNGELKLETEAFLPVLDHGVLYGVGAFETIRIYDNHPFLIEDHLQRLDDGLKRLKIRPPFFDYEWEAQIERLRKEAQLKDCSIRLTVTGGVEGLGLTASQYQSPNTMVFIRALPPCLEHSISKGKRLQLIRLPRQSAGGVESFKSSNFLNLVLGRQEICGFPEVEGVFLTKEGYLAEGIVSNLFFISDDKIFTPSLDLGILPGVTRAWVIHLANLLGYEVEEGIYKPDVLCTADEIFITNSIQEIVPIYEWQGLNKHPKRSIVEKLVTEYRRFTTRLRKRSDLKGVNNG